MVDRPHRRQVLATGVSLASVALAGCLDSDTLGGGGGDEDSSDDGSAVYVANNEKLELTITDTEASPAQVRVDADSTITMEVNNESSRTHTIDATTDSFPRMTVDGGTLNNEAWEIPSDPGDVEIQCVTHDNTLTTVTIEPMDVSSGCPTG